jgi:hypothetical protein
VGTLGTGLLHGNCHPVGDKEQLRNAASTRVENVEKWLFSPCQSETAATGVAILVVPEVTVTGHFGKLDLFSSPGVDFTFITQGTPGHQRMRPNIVARTSAGFLAANGIPLQPAYCLSTCPQPDIVYAFPLSEWSHRQREGALWA